MFSQELIEILSNHRFRDPLLDDLRSGRMTLAGLKEWCLQAMLVVRHFTRFLSAIHANCPDREGQQLLAENLWEEHGRGDPSRDHLVLIERLAAAAGATSDEIAAAQPLNETTAYIDHCLRVTRKRSFVESMAAIGIGVEYQMPRFFGGLAAALRENYGFSTAQIEYLQVHVSEDVRHSARAAKLIDRFASTEEVKEQARRALREILEVKQKFAEAVYARCRQL